MDLVELTPRLTQFRFDVGQAYLWRDGDELTLIDTGPLGVAEEIGSAIEGLGFATRQLTRVVLTHWHEDHTGSAAELAAWPGVTVIAGRADASVIRGELTGAPPVLLDWERPLHARVTRGLAPAPPARVDQAVDDGDDLGFGGGARVVAVPGHTEGSIAVLIPDERVLFTGDAVAHANGSVMLGVFNVDRDRAIASMHRLASLDVEIACFGHGDPVVGGASDVLRAAASQLVGSADHT
jgi:glyoxylase-like metal-dependent hydrolase (beta-lactamase superfamily II)